MHVLHSIQTGLLSIPIAISCMKIYPIYYPERYRKRESDRCVFKPVRLSVEGKDLNSRFHYLFLRFKAGEGLILSRPGISKLSIFN